MVNQRDLVNAQVYDCSIVLGLLCDFPMRTNVQKQPQRILLVLLSFIQLSAGNTSNTLNCLYLSAPIAEASDRLEIDSITKIRITHYAIDTSLICYAA